MEEPCLLQHPEGVHPPLGVEVERRSHRAQLEDPGPEVQLRQDDLPHVLRQAPSQGRQLQEEAVRTQQQPQTQEEAEVNKTPSNRNHHFWPNRRQNLGTSFIVNSE